MHLRLLSKPVLICLLAFAGPALPRAEESTATAIEKAHGELWRRFVDVHGVIRDFVGETPTPEDCALGRPNAIGWWSPIENGPMFTGIYLPAACERARRTGSAEDAANARRLARGLLKCASVSDVRGFIARGMGSDGKCHYPLGSDDQTHPWFYGLHAYYASDIPSAEERAEIAAKMVEVADALATNGWQCPCDGAFKGQSRGSFRGPLFRHAVRYLHMLRVMHEVTRDSRWLTEYRKALADCPAKSSLTRAEICAAGYSHDLEVIKGINTSSMWIYVGCQGALARLAALESDDTVRTQFLTGLSANARNALPAIAAHQKFDNRDTKVFGHADWRAGYPHWVPQKTQDEAEKLSQNGDKAKLGQRKSYEAANMRQPLAVAAVVALGGGEAERAAIEGALRHYDYSKLNMAEFFFAECTFYALPAKK